MTWESKVDDVYQGKTSAKVIVQIGARNYQVPKGLKLESPYPKGESFKPKSKALKNLIETRLEEGKVWYDVFANVAKPSLEKEATVKTGHKRKAKSAPSTSRLSATSVHRDSLTSANQHLLWSVESKLIENEMIFAVQKEEAFRLIWDAFKVYNIVANSGRQMLPLLSDDIKRGVSLHLFKDKYHEIKNLKSSFNILLDTVVICFTKKNCQGYLVKKNIWTFTPKLLQIKPVEETKPQDHENGIGNSDKGGKVAKIQPTSSLQTKEKSLQNGTACTVTAGSKSGKSIDGAKVYNKKQQRALKPSTKRPLKAQPKNIGPTRAQENWSKLKTVTRVTNTFAKVRKTKVSSSDNDKAGDPGQTTKASTSKYKHIKEQARQMSALKKANNEETEGRASTVKQTSDTEQKCSTHEPQTTTENLEDQSNTPTRSVKSESMDNFINEFEDGSCHDNSENLSRDTGSLNKTEQCPERSELPAGPSNSPVEKDQEELEEHASEEQDSNADHSQNICKLTTYTQDMERLKMVRKYLKNPKAQNIATFSKCFGV